MGTVVKRSPTAFRAVVRLGGMKPATKTFPTEKAAKIWIVQTEAKLSATPRPKRGNTLGFVLEKVRLLELEKPYRSSSATVLARFHREIGHVDLADCTAEWWQEMVEGWKITPASRMCNLMRIRAALVTAEAKWRITVDWEALRLATSRLVTGKSIRKGRARTRRVTDAEVATLKAFIGSTYDGKIPVADVMDFALDSAMREDEIFRITWDDLNTDAKGRHMVWIRDRKDPKDKIGNDQNIPLLGDAYKIVRRQPKRRLVDGSLDPRIFPFNSKTFSNHFGRFSRGAGVKALHFHDFRHEGISRLFEQGYGIPEVCTVSGHKNWETLRKYTHLTNSLHDGPLAHRRAA